MKITPIEKIKSFIDWIQTKLNKKQFIIFSSILIGLSVGLAAIVLKTFVHYIFLAATFKELGNFKYIFLLLPIIGLFLTVLVVKKLLQGKLDKGLSHIHYAIAKKSSSVPKEQMYAQIITSSLTIGFGGSAGLEAPIVITGAAFGTNYSKTYHLDYRERTLLLACGIAAGIGAAFNAPIAGVLFALEVLLIDISISAFTPLIISAATGALISKIILQNEILLSFQLQQPFNYTNLPFYILLGLLAGLISVYHSRAFNKIENLFYKSTNKIYLNAAIGGIGLALLFFIFPSLFGEGYQSIKILALQHPENLLDNSFFENYKSNEWFVLAFVGVLIFVKAIATALTIGGGGNGGNFAPSLFVGSYLGFFLSKCINMLHLTDLPVSNFTLVGMAGILSGIYHAPLTAIFLIAEITGGYTLMIPLMIVSSISYALSKYFEPYSMDTKKLGQSGKIFTFDRDHNILTTIRTSNLIETNFQKIAPEDTLGNLVDTIAKSKRNIFPVTDKENKLLGIIILDNIRDIMFKNEMYDKVTAKELMTIPPAIISPNQKMESVMKIFDETGAWNLPVIDNGQYIGFLSKSSVFTSYRTKLKATTIV
ncbi:MAG: chloride channel protein [Flavobacteriales bacterium CG_4_10_14_0_2_um_filter_32_8]|nr:MAG: chloride channel protein [Flavobacteriales bacterium CG_4_10_14_0_2_um_filter_32_8]PJB14696.1 MAG: chloride channel protein [Flavobacteriales bacterium CG_4_9_14_3_um_filter_32_8]